MISPTALLALKGGELEEELLPMGFGVKVFDISDYFSEEYFETKKVVYIPRGEGQISRAVAVAVMQSFTVMQSAVVQFAVVSHAVAVVQSASSPVTCHQCFITSVIHFIIH